MASVISASTGSTIENENFKMAYVGTIESFKSQDDFTIYEERFAQFCIANKISEEKIKIALLLSHMDTEVYKTLRDLCFPEAPNTKKYEDIVTLLKTHYSPQINVYRERIEFYRAIQMSDESSAEWYARLKRLAINCKFTSIDAILADRFISGMKHGPILDRLVEESTTKSISELLQIAKSKETSFSSSHENGTTIQAISTSNSNVARGQTHQWRNDRKPSNSNDRKQDGRQNKQTQKNGCKHCGKGHQGPCKYANYKCNVCNIKGHLQSVCRKKSTSRRVNFINEGDLEPSENSVQVNNTIHNDSDGIVSNIDYKLTSDSIYNINRDSIGRDPPISINIGIDNGMYEFTLDSGSPISVIKAEFYHRNLSQYPVQPTVWNFEGYTGEPIIPLGYITINAMYNSIFKDIKIYIVPNGKGNLLGRDFINTFNISFVPSAGVNAIGSIDISALMKKEFPDVCTDQLGKFKYGKIDLQLKPHFTPVYNRPRPVPLALKSKIEYELTRMEQKGMISPIISSEWSSPIVPVLRQNQTIRICGSYIGLNKNLEDIFYPLPRIDQIFASLSGNYKFSKIDLSDAYMQFELTDDSKKLVTISTHKGLFTVNRMPFGIKCASFYFQKHIEQLFQGVDNVFMFQDDILIGHKRGENPFHIIRRVLTILRDAGLTINIEKCQFLQNKLSYLGFDVSEEGLSKNKDKIKAIMDAPQPTNLTQVRAFVGMANHYSKFIRNITEILHPFYRLMKKNTTFHWDENCKKAFESIKAAIASDQVLTYFNSNLPIIVTCDASEKGIAAVLSHIMENNVERPVACVSRTYSKAEQNYSTVHKESLACFFAVTKFQEYLYGHKFTLRTDQKSLTTIFNHNREINHLYANRLKRYALYLSNFDYTIEHIKGKDNEVADCLSRLPIKVDNTEDDDGSDKIYFTNYQIPIDNKKIIEETDRDLTLNQIKNFIQTQWPSKITPNIKPYYDHRLELHIINGCLMLGHKIIIPNSLQQQVLNELHSTHEGIVRTKAMARSYLWFPNLDKRIEEMCKSCNHCLKVRSDPPRSVLSWPTSNQPFNTIHIDFFTVFNKNFLVIVDSYSKWPEVYIVKDITSDTTINHLRDCFSRFGLPVCVVSDNGPSLVSEEMENFFYSNGIKHVTIPPYNPQSNGLAENIVKTTKNKLISAISDPLNKDLTLSTLLARFLLTYRNTPHCTTGESPAEMMFGRKLRIRLDLIKKTASFESNCNKEYRTFKVGDIVIIRDYKRNKRMWTNATVIKQLGGVTYLCKLENGSTCKRHLNQIRSRSITASHNTKAQSLQTKPTLIKKKIGYSPTTPPTPNPNPADPLPVTLPQNDNADGDEPCSSSVELSPVEDPTCSHPTTPETSNHDQSQQNLRPQRNRQKPAKYADYLTK